MPAQQQTPTGDLAIDRLRKRNRPLRVLIDLLVSVAVTLVLSAGFWSVASAGGAFGHIILILVVLAPLLIFAIPATVGVVGLATGRVGFVVGPLLFCGAIAGLSHIIMKREHASLGALVSPGLAPAAKTHDMLAIEGQALRCDHACIRILATSTMSLAVWDGSSRSWVIFRRPNGEACLAPEQAASTLEFLEAGYRGRCAVRTTGQYLDDALIFRDRSVAQAWPLPELPPAYSGRVVDVSERIAGEERLLGRRLVGSLNVRFPAALEFYARKAEQVDVGPKLQLKTFLAAALGISDSELDARPSFPPADILDELESYFDRPEFFQRAPSAWLSVARVQGRAHPDVLQARIERFLASDNPVRVGFALQALFELPPADRAFAQDRMVELAFGLIGAETNSPMVGLLKGHLGSTTEPLRSDTRERATSRFVNDPTLSIAQRGVLYMVMARGTWDTRREANEVVFSLSGVAFEDAVQATGAGEYTMWGLAEPLQWSRAEVDRLIARATDIPTMRLRRYLDRFRFGQIVTREQRDMLAAQLGERLRAAEAAPARDDQQINELQRLVEIIPKNIRL